MELEGQVCSEHMPTDSGFLTCCLCWQAVRALWQELLSTVLPTLLSQGSPALRAVSCDIAYLIGPRVFESLPV